MHSIDKYLGEFGNIISVWRNNTIDFTSYATRYEQSDHVCRYTNTYNDMVDYDGAFYPPALDKYLRTKKSLSAIDAFVNEEYSHLNIANDADALSRTTSCCYECYS